ncbi:MAG: hypothetical protein HY815_16035 [Candidatus Riflebacteria bacterium]|nr:hypothetical protein [Candidatus Riflebacteria bacterium]
MIERARNEPVGKNDNEVIGFLTDAGFGRQEATQAVGLAVMEEGGAGTLWQVVQGLTALARQKQHTDERVTMEKRAGALLNRIN